METEDFRYFRPILDFFDECRYDAIEFYHSIISRFLFRELFRDVSISLIEH